jgi:hypothetical protein
MRKVNAFLLTVGFIFLLEDCTAWGKKKEAKHAWSFNQVVG